MTTIVETCWGPRPIDDAPYWHLVGASWLFYNNVPGGSGLMAGAVFGKMAGAGAARFALSR